MYRWQKPPILPSAYASAVFSSTRRWRGMECSSSLLRAAAPAEAADFSRAFVLPEARAASVRAISRVVGERSADVRRLDLLPGVVAGTDEGAGLDVPEAHRH